MPPCQGWPATARGEVYCQLRAQRAGDGGAAAQVAQAAGGVPAADEHGGRLAQSAGHAADEDVVAAVQLVFEPPLALGR
ncbi:hypothetical protein GCM10010315_40330 [Streptomyces luteosporeus]|uniref:Uncharacterized protein n=1 Tax=Streptomyces luteosporeus TaxID=173856 RepID=A0ABP6GEP7_9ACTN